jgi:hypothetical protein
MDNKSEFGKGLVICLVKFAEHFMKLGGCLRQYAEMREKHPEQDTTLFTEQGAVEMWANAASDHLYEIEVPEGKDWDEIREKVDDLKSLGLQMGHGFTRQFTKENAFSLQDTTREIAMLIDKKLGLKPDIGKW